MAGTYTQIYVQIVFSVKCRRTLIAKEWKQELYQYISGIIREKGHKAFIINGVEDHIHIFLSLRPSACLSDLVRDIKNNSSNFINSNKFINTKFSWQSGYGAFTYSHSQIDRVYNYILRQEEHHRKVTFEQEYTKLLQKFDVRYKEQFLFDLS